MPAVQIYNHVAIVHDVTPCLGHGVDDKVTAAVIWCSGVDLHETACCHSAHMLT